MSSILVHFNSRSSLFLLYLFYSSKIIRYYNNNIFAANSFSSYDDSSSSAVPNYPVSTGEISKATGQEMVHVNHIETAKSLETFRNR